MRPSPVSPRRIATGVAVLALAVSALAACGSDDSSSASGGDGGGSGEGVDVKLGYFPNLTHATAIVGVEQGYYEDALAEDGATVTEQTFNSGTDTIEAMLAGGLDATYIGPSPTVTAFAQSGGQGVQVIAGAASGGAALVVQPDIKDLSDLEGEVVATPSVGNTQDIAARYYFKQEGYTTDVDGGGDISIVGQDNSVTTQAFQQGEIAGAWVPEPYISILEKEGGHVLVDEAELWPDGQFVTTQLIVRTAFAQEHPDLVTDLLTAHVEANAYINESPDEAKKLVGEALLELTQSELPPEVLTAAWDNLTFTNDPLPSTLIESAKHAEDVEVIDPVEADLNTLYDLDPLNEVLAEAGEPEVAGP